MKSTNIITIVNPKPKFILNGLNLLDLNILWTEAGDTPPVEAIDLTDMWKLYAALANIRTLFTSLVPVLLWFAHVPLEKLSVCLNSYIFTAFKFSLLIWRHKQIISQREIQRLSNLNKHTLLYIVICFVLLFFFVFTYLPT